MTKAVIYSNGNQESERAAQLLSALDTEFQIYKLNNHFTQRAFENEFGKDTPYPQVAIGAHHVGGLKEALQFCRAKGMLKTS